jgi:hypothetical protein
MGITDLAFFYGYFLPYLAHKRVNQEFSTVTDERLKVSISTD